MTRFFIVRHGETTYNASGRIQGHLDIELTDLGLEQAKLAAERLKTEKIDAIYSSDLKRASVTGEIIAEPHGLPIITTPLLREAFLGEWQGLNLEEVAQKYPNEHAAYSKDSISNRPPGAERLEHVIARCRQFIDEALEAHPNQSLAVACHGGSVRGLVAAILNLGPELYRRVRVDNGSLTIMELSRNPDKPRDPGPGNRTLIVTLNDTCHMAGQGVGDGVDG